MPGPRWLHKLAAEWQRNRRRRAREIDREAQVPQLFVTRLEERRVLNAGAVAAAANPMVVDAGAAIDNGQVDSFRAEHDGDPVQGPLDGTDVGRAGSDELAPVAVEGSLDDNSGAAGLDDSAGPEGAPAPIAGGEDGANVFHRTGARPADKVAPPIYGTTGRLDMRQASHSAHVFYADTAEHHDKLTASARESVTAESQQQESTDDTGQTIDIGGLDSRSTANPPREDQADVLPLVSAQTETGGRDVWLPGGETVVDSTLETHAAATVRSPDIIAIAEQAGNQQQPRPIVLEATDISQDGQILDAAEVMELDGREGLTVVRGAAGQSTSVADRTDGTAHVLGAHDELLNRARIDAPRVAGGGTTLVGGVVTGGGDLTRNGAGAAVPNANPYARPTTISQGRLTVVDLIDGHLVVDGGVLGGSGTVNGNVTLVNGSVAPGNSPGRISVNADVTLQGPGSFDVEMDGTTAGTQYDQLRVEGANRTVTLNGPTLNIVLGNEFVPGMGDSFTIIDNVNANSRVVGNFQGLDDGDTLLIGSQAFVIHYDGGDGNDVVLSQDSTVLIEGTNGDDTIVVWRKGANVEVRVNGATVLDVPDHQVANITVMGLDGDDTLTVDHTYGFVDTDIRFDGGTETSRDLLSVVGDGSQSAVYTPDATVPGNGTVEVFSSGLARIVLFSHLEPVDISGMVTATLSLPNHNDQLTLTNGTDFLTGVRPAIRVAGNSDGVAIEEVAFFANSTVIINTADLDGSDQITVNSADDAHQNTNLTISTGNGNDNITFNGTVAVTGTVRINGLARIADNNGATVDVIAGALDVTASAIGAPGVNNALDTTLSHGLTASTAATNGGIFIRETGDLPIRTIDANAGDVFLTAGGSIREATLGNAVNIIADNLQILSLGAIGGSGGPGIGGSGPLDIQANSVTAHVAGAGGLFLKDANGLMLNRLHTNNGAIEVFSTGAVTAVDVVANGDVTLIAAIGNLTIGNVSAAAHTVTLSSLTGAIVDDGNHLTRTTAESLIITAITGVGSADAIETSVGSLNLRNLSSGNVALNESDSLSIDRLHQSALAGTVNVDAGGPVVIVGGKAGVRSARGQIQLDANGFRSDIAVNATVATTTGAIDLSADNRVTFGGSGGIVSGAGNVTVKADADSAGGGGIIMADGSTINAGSGRISLDADQNITLGGLITTNGGASAVAIRTNRGVFDAGDSHIDIVAMTGTLAIDAATGIGSSNDIETQVGTLTVQNTLAGNIGVNETGGVLVHVLRNSVANDNNALTGTIRLTAGGTITVVNAGQGVHAIDGDVLLNANGPTADVDVRQAVTNSDSGRVTISAGNQVRLADTGDVTAGAEIMISAGDPTQPAQDLSLISIHNDTLLTTGFGQISGKVYNSPDPLGQSQNVGPPLQGAVATAEVDVEVSDSNGVNFLIAVNWREGNPGTVRVPPPDIHSEVIDSIIPGEVAFSYQHEYTSNPEPDPSDDINVFVSITAFAANPAVPSSMSPGTILLDVNGQSVLTNPRFSTTLVIPVVNLTVRALKLPAPEPLPSVFAEPVKVEASFEFTTPEPQVVAASLDTTSSIGTTGEFGRYYELRTVFFGETGTLDDRRVIIRLNALEQNALRQDFELSDLPDLFERLPDDRYRIYLIEDGAERLVLDFLIRQGQPVETPLGTPADETDQPDDPVLETDAPAPSDAPVTPLDEADRQSRGAPATVPHHALKEQVDSNVVTDATVLPESTFAERLGALPFVSQGGTVLSAVTVGLAYGEHWERLVDRAIERVGAKDPVTEKVRATLR